MAERNLVWYLNERDWERFVEMLEAPETDMPKLREVMTNPTIFDNKPEQ